jgi:16S rRNA (cytidine1402-2'-O)-methyltransferase
MVLFVVATPIGNLKDLSERAKEVIKEADLVVCESRERALKILNFLGLKKRLIYMPAPREKDLARKIAEEIKNENLKAVLLVSAGTPGLSDPGSFLVRECREIGVPVIPVPGPSALSSAVSVSGIPIQRVLFLGFLPKKGRKNFLSKVKDALDKLPFSLSVVIFESPHRISETLNDIQDVFGDINLFLAREMTKVHEEYIFGNVDSVKRMIEKKGKLKGEITLVLELTKFGAD